MTNSRILAAALDLPAEWEAAFRSVPRHLFIPDHVWDRSGDGLRPVARADDPDAWLERVYSDQALITQFDDGETKPGQAGTYPSSSASMPSIVAMMLTHLDIKGDETVLEIGTGTGWNAALLSARLGDNHVTSIEVDADIADQARKALTEAGLNPTVVTADGADGYAPHSPYDRVIATAAARYIPYPWVTQTRPGGIILTPWGNAYDNGALLRLTVTGDGTATGRIVGDVGFMWLRAQRTPHGSVEDRVYDQDRAQSSTTTLHPYHVVSDPDGCFAVGIQIPDCHVITVFDNDDTDNPYTVWFMHPGSDSWASLRVEHDSDTYQVRQLGPRNLWGEVETAYRQWADLGRPARERFGFTVTPEWQYVWLDQPDGPSWALPARGE